MDKKISQLTAKGANLASTDLLEISEVITDGYASKYVTGAEVIASAQTGMQEELISGTNIKTINSNSLLGSGDVAVQPTLVSGTNIKTVNGNSLLGSGDLVISTGLTIGTTAITSGTVGRLLFEGTGNVVQESANLFWDNTNSRLGIGTATPSALLHTVGSVTASGGAARGNFIQPTLVASANSDVLTALHINPTYTLGAFTGIDRYGLLIQGDFGSSAIGNGNHLRLNGTNNANSTRFLITNNFNSLMVFTCIGSSDTNFNSALRGKNVLIAPSGLMITSNNAGSIGPTDVALTIFQNKNVAIDTTTDAGYKLDVNGTARVQGKLSVNTPSATSAVMEVTSTTQGFLPPRMTNAQMVAIATPASGLMVYDTTNNKMCVYDGTAWQNLY